MRNELFQANGTKRACPAAFSMTQSGAWLGANGALRAVEAAALSPSTRTCTVEPSAMLPDPRGACASEILQIA